MDEAKLTIELKEKVDRATHSQRQPPTIIMGRNKVPRLFHSLDEERMNRNVWKSQALMQQIR
jgi:hypothetical protein